MQAKTIWAIVSFGFLFKNRKILILYKFQSCYNMNRDIWAIVCKFYVDFECSHYLQWVIHNTLRVFHLFTLSHPQLIVTMHPSQPSVICQPTTQTNTFSWHTDLIRTNTDGPYVFHYWKCYITVGKRAIFSEGCEVCSEFLSSSWQYWNQSNLSRNT